MLRQASSLDEVIIPTRAEAEEVVDQLFDILSRDGVTTVADLYEIVGVNAERRDERWGWKDLRAASVRRIRTGYLLDLPKPELLETRVLYSNDKEKKMNKKQMAGIIALLAAILTFLAVRSAKNK